MDKREVINKLNTLDCEIAEVICDITTSTDEKPCYSNESVLVFLVKQPSNDDLIKNNKHWTICDSIDDFNEGIVYGEGDAKKAYCNYYVSEFKEVKPFSSDFTLVV